MAAGQTVKVTPGGSQNKLADQGQGTVEAMRAELTQFKVAMEGQMTALRSTVESLVRDVAALAKKAGK